MCRDEEINSYMLWSKSHDPSTMVFGVRLDVGCSAYSRYDPPTLTCNLHILSISSSQISGCG